MQRKTNIIGIMSVSILVVVCLFLVGYIYFIAPQSHTKECGKHHKPSYLLAHHANSGAIEPLSDGTYQLIIHDTSKVPFAFSDRPCRLIINKITPDAFTKLINNSKQSDEGLPNAYLNFTLSGDTEHSDSTVVEILHVEHQDEGKVFVLKLKLLRGDLPQTKKEILDVALVIDDFNSGFASEGVF